MQRAQEDRVPASALRIEDIPSAALPNPLHGVGNTPRAQQCLESAWHSPALRYSCSQSYCAASRGMQKPHFRSLCRSIGSSCTHPFSSFFPIPGSWPCRVFTILAFPGYLQNAVSGDSLISQGAAFLRFPFLHNVHSLAHGPFLEAVPDPSHCWDSCSPIMRPGHYLALVLY